MLDTIAALLLAVTQAGPTPDGWTLKQLGEPWQVAMEPRPDYRRGLIEQTIQVVFPGSTESQPGWFAAAERVVQPPAGHRCELVFRAGDSFTGPTAGYHFLQARLDERVVWEADVAAAPLGGAEVRIELAEALAGRAEATLALGVWDKQRVTNFPVAAWFSGVSLWVDGARRVELTAAAPYRFEPLPPDLPLPAAPPNLAWTPSARIVQPWGDTEHLAVAEAVSWAPRLAHDYGFETIILLPPAAHNAITPAAKHLTPSQFEAGLAEYRRAGFRFVLYSSLMHCGHDPAWQTGRLQREHPEWSQRDSKGNPVTEYGAEWLCPNTGAFDHCLRYTLDLVRRYHADAVMLDNQEFLNSTAGLPTCYCDACRQRFRDYVAQRFGPDATRRIFGVGLDQLTIPTAPGDLWRLWIHWRNRVWAEATERFRTALRAERRDLVLLTNTAYEFDDWLLATDLQYPHEDAMLSESRGLTSRGMSAKLQLGQALARGRPLWNYLGTFREDDYTRLREPAEVEGMLAVSLARQARPWVVFYGFAEHPEENVAALEVLGRYVRFARDEAGPARSGAPPRPAAQVLSLLSLRARNYLHAPLHPPHQALLTAAGVPFDTALETDLPRLDLSAYRLIVAEGTVCMTDAELAALLAYVRGGGVLVASGEAGAGDELGRLRGRTPLRRPAGKGRVVMAETLAEVAEAVGAAAGEPVAQAEPGQGSEVIAYRPAAKRLEIHVVGHGGAAMGDVLVRPPARFGFGRAEWHVPGRPPVVCTPVRDGGRLRFTLPGTVYAVLLVTAG